MHAGAGLPPPVRGAESLWDAPAYASPASGARWNSMKILYLFILNAMLIGTSVIATSGLPGGSITVAEAYNGSLYADTPIPVAGPVQENLTPPEVFHRDIREWHFTMTAIARYTLCGKLVGRDNYSGSSPDTLAPMDLSVAWGKLIEAPYEDHVSYYKAPRHLNYHYHFPADCPVLNYSYINEHSSNNHCIFANESVWTAAEGMDIGEYVEIKGYLVDVYGENSPGSTYTWNTSRSRADMREGACEIVWVEEVAQVSGTGFAEDMNYR